VVSARLGGRDVVVKLYGRKRPWFPTLARSFGHRFLVAKTGLGARTRRDTEARLLRLWREHGFAVPEVLELSLPEPESRPYLVLERVDGGIVQAELRDAAIPLERLEVGIARFAAEWCARHALAERLCSRPRPRALSFAPARPSGRVGDLRSRVRRDPRRVDTLVAVSRGLRGIPVRAAGPRAEPPFARSSPHPDRERPPASVDPRRWGRFRARSSPDLPRVRAAGRASREPPCGRARRALENTERAGERRTGSR
jgi:hypothetical protein